MRKLTLFLAAALAALLLLASCGPSAVETQGPSVPPSPTATPEPTPTPEPVPATPAPVAIETVSYLDAGHPDGYGELTESQKMLYGVMDEALRDIIENGWDPDKTYPLEYSVTGAETNRAKNLFCVRYSAVRSLTLSLSFGDHSGDTFDWIGTGKDDWINTYRDRYWEIEDAAEEILSGLTCDGTEYGKALAIAAWLAENVPYAHDYAERLEDWWLSSVYGPLLKGEAICGGYADAYEFLCRKAGLDVLYLEGSTGAGDHAWNMVRVGENWYHVDTTWMASGHDLLQYFMMSDEVGRSTGHLDWWVPGMLLADAVEPPVADHDGLYKPEYQCRFETAEQALAFFEGASHIDFMRYRLVFGSDEERMKFYQLTETVIANREGDYYMNLLPLEGIGMIARFYDVSSITFAGDEP